MALPVLLIPLLLAEPLKPPPYDPSQYPQGTDDADTTEGDEARPVMLPPGESGAPDDVDTGVIEGRRRPGQHPGLPERVSQDNPGALRAPPPEAFPTDEVPIPDRWRLIQTLGLVTEHWWDPYHQNTYKGDRPINRAKVPWLPIKGDDWFFTAGLVSDTVFEPRTLPIPPGATATGSSGVLGKDTSFLFRQTILASASLVKGQTTFKPPVVEYKLAVAFNVNYLSQPVTPAHRTDDFLGLQSAYVDHHLRDVSDRYDFDAIRIGIQPFQADFRGFLFNDQQLGVRLYGNRDGNRFQYNIAAFWRLEKDTNSGLNSLTQSPRDDMLFIANLYRQDFLIPALTSQITLAWNRNREGNDIEIDRNGHVVRPALIGNLKGRDYDVFYLGYNADGHVGRINLTASVYGALGSDRDSIFTGRKARIRAFFAAAEASYDHDWMRFRLSGLWASGDHDPNDDTETGFDAVFESPIFAGADTSYWIRQSVPFTGGNSVIAISGRNGVLNDLRSSKEQGQSNFNNPGTVLAGLGADFDLTPELRLSTNANHLWFEDTAVLETLRNKNPIARNIGWDLSAAAIWRPKATQNIVFRLSAAALLPGKGFKALFDNSSGDRNHYSILANAVLTY